MTRAGNKRKTLGEAPQHIVDSLFPGRGPSSKYVTPREELAQRIVSDERDEMIEEVISECVDAGTLAAEEIGTYAITYSEMESIAKTILLTAANIWGISRDSINS